MNHSGTHLEEKDRIIIVFTGIVEARVTVTAIDPDMGTPSQSHTPSRSTEFSATPEFVTITIDAPGITDTLNPGDSLAVNGVCLTDAGHTGTAVVLEVMGETLDRTTIGALRLGDQVNLERALAPSDRLGGHIVQGHVDGTARLLGRTSHDNWEVFRFTLPSELARYVVEKGSIAVSGTSLTVSAVAAPGDLEQWFEVSLIPTTMRKTILGALTVGDLVNIEVDILAKYIERNATVSNYLAMSTAHATEQTKG